MLNVLWGKNLNQSSIPNAQVKCAVGEEGRLSFRNAVAVLALMFCLQSSNSFAVTDDNIPFKIPQQRADTALILFAEQANLTLVVPFDQVKEFTANRLVGNYPIDTAINILLQDTGLMPTFSNQLVLNIAIDDKGKSMNTNTRKTLLASMVGLFAAGGMATATAQDSVGESARAQGVLDEIIITAEKRSASLQQVPIAVTAFTGEQLANAGIEEAEDLEIVTPGLNFLTNTGIGIITIRGVGAPLSQGPGFDPSSSVYIDGVYQSRFSGSILSLMDLERVEVLKGPQGTLYGRNSVGGSVNYITQGPSDEFGAKINVQVGNYNLRKVQGILDIPLIENKLLLRAALMRTKRDGYFENLLIPGDEMESEDLFAGRFTLKYMPSDELDIILRAGFSDQEGPTSPGFKQIDIDPNSFVGGATIIKDPRKVLADQPNDSENEKDYADLTIKWDLGSTSLTSITAYSDHSTGPFIRDIDATELPVLHNGTDQQTDGLFYEGESFSQEFLLSSSTDNGFDWLVGMFYFHENAFQRSGSDLTGIGLTYNQSIASNTTDAYSIFGHISYNLTESLRVNAGLRYGYEEKDFTHTRLRDFVVVQGPGSQSEDWDSITPKLGLDYFVNDDVMLYITASRGFKSGGFNSTGSVGEPPLDEEILDAVEVGAKSTLLDGRMTLNASAFTYDFTDMQVLSVNPNGSGGLYRNAGEAEMQGMEIEMSALPFESLQLDIGLSFLDTEYTDFEIVGGNLKGNELPSSPEFTANVGIKYTYDLNNFGRFIARANYYYSAEQFFNEQNNQGREDAYDLINLRASLESEDESWVVSIYGKNVTDELVKDWGFASPFLFGDGLVATFTPPRTYGAELTYRF
ncbi:TonB-dependent receptor domain-containing protein [SAR92 clade bacterium H246]